jgi:hypothetical protein
LDQLGWTRWANLERAKVIDITARDTSGTIVVIRFAGRRVWLVGLDYSQE